jgi:predicted XRE-type DNA-binding protein
MKARNEAIMAIGAIVDDWDGAQAHYAARIGVIQPRLNNFLKRRIDEFSLNALIVLAEATALSMVFTIAKRAG